LGERVLRVACGVFGGRLVFRPQPADHAARFLGGARRVERRQPRQDFFIAQRAP
jgi:hypothetical protein